MATHLPSASGFRFGAFELDVRSGDLRKHGIRIALQEQPRQILALLLQTPGAIISRETLRQTLWPSADHTFVDFENSLNAAVGKLRQVLGDSADRSRFIETCARKGYRFIATVETIGAAVEPEPVIADLPTSQGAGSDFKPTAGRRYAVLGLAGVLTAVLILGVSMWMSKRPTPPRSFQSLAVLPLKNLSGDPAQDYLADGITEELTTNLARIGSLRVISRTSSMGYASQSKPVPQIGQELKVDAVVEGSVIRSGNKVRITAQLIDARRDVHLWARSYERNFGEILDLEDSIAVDIASEVKAELSQNVRGVLTLHRAVRPEAYEAYLRGRNEVEKQTQATIRNSTRYFLQAIDLDPLYAAGYAGLSDSYSLMANYGVLKPREAFPRAEAAARRALELDPSLAEAHTSLAFAKHHFDWDWPGAEAEYRRAIELGPGYAMAYLRYAEFLSNSGRHAEAIREIGKARDLDPLSLIVVSNVGRVLFNARRYDDAIRELKGVLALDPNRTYVRIHLGMAYAQKGMYPEAIEEAKRVSEFMGGEPRVDLAEAYALAGQASLAKRILHEYVEVPSESGVLDWVFIAGVYAGLGDKDAAFAWLGKAYENRDFFLTYLNVYPFLDPLHSDPRFARLAELVGNERH